jgi:tetratricopeptide (TPR) repeat protein
MLHQLRFFPECRWTSALEAGYQDLRAALVRASRSRSGTASTTAPTGLSGADVELFHKLRFARLCAFLRQRMPDDGVEHTILIYRLSDDDVREALRGAPVEAVPGSLENERRIADASFAEGALTAAASFYAHLIRRQPDVDDAAGAEVAANLGVALMGTGRHAEAIGAFREGLRRDPGYVRIGNNLAWLLATSPSSQLRNGAEAVRLATAASKATGGREPTVLDTLSAACAEQGRFDEAQRHAQVALQIARENGLTDLAEQITSHIERYRSRRPIRDP